MRISVARSAAAWPEPFRDWSCRSIVDRVDEDQPRGTSRRYFRAVLLLERRMVYRRILVPVDGSATSIAGLNEAVRLAKSQNARLRLIHIVDERMIFSTAEAGLNVEPVIDSLKKGGKRILDRAAKLAASRGIRPETEVAENAVGRVADVLVARAKRWRADLIVM